MSGMLATGSSGMERTPISTITMEMTIAKIGRLMNIELKAPMAQFPSLVLPVGEVAAAISVSVCGVTGKPGRARRIPFTM